MILRYSICVILSMITTFLSKCKYTTNDIDNVQQHAHYSVLEERLFSKDY